MKILSKRFTYSALLIVLISAIALFGCGSTANKTGNEGTDVGTPNAGTQNAGNAGTEVALPTQDRAGNPITVPPVVNKIVSLSPALTQTLYHLGLQDKIVAMDTNSLNVPGISQDTPTLDMITPDAELILSLEPDLVLASTMSLYSGSEQLAMLQDQGVTVAYLPTSKTIAEIQEDIRFIAAMVGESDKAATIIADMQAQIDEVAAVAATIPQEERKTVFFEISPAPDLYSIGPGSFINDMIEVIGATNVFADRADSYPVSAEDVVAANPDVILSNVNFMGDPVPEIMARDGFASVTAVQTKQVYYVDNNGSSLPNEYIVDAIKQMAHDVYPEYYGEVAAADNAA
jgi:iron complex transport system substrate-binding protein